MSVFWRRWLFLVLGGALFTPYAILALIAVPLSVPALATAGNALLVAVASGVLVVAIVVTSLLPIVRTLEATVVPALLAGPAGDLVVVPAQTWGDRWRNTAWYVMHTVVGAVVSVASVLIPPVALTLLFGAVAGEPRIELGAEPVPVGRAWAAPIALALLLALVLAVWMAGTAAAWAAPRLLGPDPAARLAELERRTRELTERSRLARELHDSIGHALTVTTLQASAARTVLHSNPGFAEQALLAIEQTGRVAAADLDDFLGLLREERAPRAPQPSLQDLEVLVGAHREAGLPVRLEVVGDLGRVAAVVSREVYRIVQEGLTNVQRHAGSADTTVRVVVGSDELTAEVRNSGDATPDTPSRDASIFRGRTPDTPSRDASIFPGRGGRGLAGIRERVQLLGGSCQVGPDSDGWLLRAVVPTGAGR